MKPKTYCEKWPVGCQFCDLLLCDGKEETAEKRCNPCKPTQPECGECEYAKPITNADRIRAMTDEELAEFLLNRDLDIVEKASKSVGFTYKVCREPCLVNVIDWLKQEVE